ncbi:YhaN family protein [Desulfobulbus oligotrophicus]|uniref:AAA family ATPase n=1 Tax=Desulfobulbus oligotrophicus TaxID=1909699 RepID=A0A7T6APK1_9BACT|nr:YhaN family protein [Desulfobulbus oligotrophicus]QQG64638.1 AAA family ATPase [Desulfobulbus oligotrophicus]
MKIKRLDLLAFGPFTKKSLDLSDGKPGLHVVHGPNEAGKSSTLRALKAWLFGIDARSTDNFVHDHKQLRVGGVLETSDGKEIACVRRKGNKGTLLSADTEQPIGDDTLSRLLPGLDEKLFSQLHGIDHAGLVQGGQAILEQSGDLGKSLFGAALGTQGKTDLLGELASEADKLFKSRGQNQIINDAAVKLKEARREEKHESVSVREWKELQKSLKEAEEIVANIDEEIAEARRSKSKLERFRRVTGPLAERRDLLDRQAALGDVVLLPEDFASRRQASLDKRSLARERLQKASSKLDRVRQEAEGLEVPQGLLENQEAIEDLQLQLGAFQKSVKDKPVQDAKRREHRNAAQAMLTSIRPDLDLESVETMKPLLNKKKLIVGLAQEWSLLKQKASQIVAKQRELADEKTSLLQQLEAVPGAGKDVASLKAAVLAARKSGDLAQMLRKARDAADQQEDACSVELSRLGRFDGTLEALARRAMPEKAVLDSFEKKFDQLDEQTRETTRRKVEAEQELDHHQESLKILLRSSEVPSLEDLLAARGHREQGWRLIRGTYVDGVVDPGDAAVKYAGSKNLPDAYEQAVLAADDVGDRLRHDAQRVHERASLETQIQTRTEVLSGLNGKLSELVTARAQLENAWQAVWSGIADKVGTPKEMKEWLQRVEQLLQKAEQLDRARAEVRSLEAILTSHIEALSAELEKLGQQQESKADELESLLARCEQFVSQQETAIRRKGELKASLQKLEVQLKGATDTLRLADDDLQSWGATWAEAVEGLGLGTKPHPELALATIEKLEELFRELKDADTAHKRIYGMDKDEERFTAAVAQLVQRICLEVGKQTPAELTQSLVKRLGKAQADAASLQKLRAQISELEEEVAEAHQDILLAEQNLAALRIEAGVSSDEELAPVEEHSCQKRQLISRLETLQQQLHQSGEGHSIDELEKEAQELDVDQVGDDLSQLDARLSDLASRRDAKRDQRQALLVQIQALDGSSKAAEAAERAEQLLAGIVPNAEQYLRLTIARLILEEQMERHRQNNQTPVLRRAGELFAKLTLGSFSRLRDEVDDNGKPVLLGVRADKAEVSVDGMSDGTRDQLFLALRLATMELQRDHQDPVPFVVDDIMVGFDDKRSKACLEVLADFAQKTQVLVFTHHSMVAQAARALGTEKGVFVHELVE